jgi:diacylglycerol kinase (ATP)
MRAAAILGLGCSPKLLKSFQIDPSIEWRMGMPVSAGEADVILLLGGDGTIHRHLGSLVKLGLPVLIVPAGSGNDFARALGLNRVRAMAAWRDFCAGHGKTREIDLGVITPYADAGGAPAPHVAYYFCCVAGVGLDGEISRRANGLPRWLRGHGGYALSLVPSVFSFAPFPMKVSTRDAGRTDEWVTRSDQPAILAAFANTPFYGGGMKVAPRAKLDDGLLDVCIIGGIDPFKLFCLFPTVYAGKHLSVRGVEYFQSARARIETECPLDVYADGEFVCRTPVEIGIQKAALRVIVSAV